MYVYVIISLQKREAEHPKVEVVQVEEEVVHEENEWGELPRTNQARGLCQTSLLLDTHFMCINSKLQVSNSSLR